MDKGKKKEKKQVMVDTESCRKQTEGLLNNILLD